MQNKLIPILKAIRILDEDNTVSFTSLYLFVGLTLFAFPITAESLGVITLVFAHANSKRFSRYKLQQQAKSEQVKNDDDKQKMIDLQTQIESMQKQINLKKLT
jgi:hypothetical protein